MKIITFNIRRGSWFWGWKSNGRKDKIAEIIKSYETDIFCLQEALEFQYNDIQLALPNYYKSYGVGRNDGKWKGEFCPIFYNKDRYELLDSGTFWLSNTPDKVGTSFPFALSKRICTWVKLKEGDKEFFVYNTHYYRFFNGLRKKSIDLLIKRIRSPFVLVGDFNANINNSSMRDMKRFNYTYFDKKQIDFIITSKDIAITSYNFDYERKYPSDHYALIGVLKF